MRGYGAARPLRRLGLTAALAVAMIAPGAVRSAADQSATDLAKLSQNPVADLVSVPFQNNTAYELGPRDRTQNVLNIQPVIPLSLGEDWLLITRTILPIVSQPSFARGQRRQNGTGDISFTGFVSPRAPAFGRLIWGAGPVVNVPTASDERLGFDAWGAGMSAVGLVSQGPVVAGVLVNNVWSLEGESFSNFLLQYFLNYNLPKGWYLSSAPIMTANWKADDDAWTVPVGGGFGKVHRFGGLPPVNVGFQAYYNVEKPKFGADWSTRAQITILLPK
jgi:hypothetical protein